MVVFDGQITVEIGATDVSKEDVTNIELVRYREIPQPSLRAITVMNSVPPVGFHQLHKWIEGEIHVKSEAYDAIHGQAVDYLPTGAASPACPHLLVKVLTTASAGWTATFTGAKITNEEHAQGHDREGIIIYRFVAVSVVLEADA